MIRFARIVHPRRPAPEADGKTALTRHGPRKERGADIYINAQVLQELEFAVESRPDKLQLGLLIGTAAEGSPCDFVEINGFAELSAFFSLKAWREELVKYWRLIFNRIGRAWPKDQLLGWVVLAPEVSDHMRAELEMLHRSFFGLPWQVLLVVDSAAQTMSLRAPNESGALISTGFILVTPIGATKQE